LTQNVEGSYEKENAVIVVLLEERKTFLWGGKLFLPVPRGGHQKAGRPVLRKASPGLTQKLEGGSVKEIRGGTEKGARTVWKETPSKEETDLLH